jgi:hypothetical protein
MMNSLRLGCSDQVIKLVLGGLPQQSFLLARRNKRIDMCCLRLLQKKFGVSCSQNPAQEVIWLV